LTPTTPSVALVSHSWGSAAPTGVHRYGRGLAMALARRADTRVTLCSPGEPGGRQAANDFGWVPRGVRVSEVRGPRRAVLLGWWTIGRPRIDRAAGAADLVHVTQAVFPVPTRRPVVYTVHDLLPHQHPEWYPRQSRIGHERSLRALEHAAAVITDSSWTADAVRELPWVDPAIVAVVAPGVEPRFRDEPPDAEIARAGHDLDVERDQFDLFVGHVTARKNLAVVVEALARTDSRRPLVIAGSPGDASAEIEALARRLGVAERLRWAGFVTDDELNLLLHGARALLHPCPAEGFGFTPLEAMAAGTATVVADEGALPETVGDAAIRCAPGDPDAWAAAIDALDDAGVVDDLGQRGRQHVAQFEWDNVADRIAAVYRRALERSAGGR
jgi:glycosyltransferase involved in cell wall biosynthesis